MNKTFFFFLSFDQQFLFYLFFWSKQDVICKKKKLTSINKIGFLLHIFPMYKLYKNFDFAVMSYFALLLSFYRINFLDSKILHPGAQHYWFKKRGLTFVWLCYENKKIFIITSIIDNTLSTAYMRYSFILNYY